MAYYGIQEPENIRAQIRSTRGETIDLSIPITCTLGELRNFLVDEYDYSPDTRLVFNNRPAPDNSLVNDYPYGSLLITSGASLPKPQQQQQPVDHAAQRAGATNRFQAQQPEAPQLPQRQPQQYPSPSRTVGGGAPPPSNPTHPAQSQATPPPQQQQQPQPPPPQQTFQQRPTYPTSASQSTANAPPAQPPARKPAASPSAQQQQQPQPQPPQQQQQQPKTAQSKTPSPVVSKKASPPAATVAPAVPETRGPNTNAAVPAPAAPQPSPQSFPPAGGKEGAFPARAKGASPSLEPPGPAAAPPPSAVHTSSGKETLSSQEGGLDSVGGSGSRQSNHNRDSSSNVEVNGSRGGRSSSKASRGTPRGGGDGPSGGAPPSHGSHANTTAAPSDEVSEEKAPWQLATFTVSCVIPDLDKTVSLQVHGDASVADLVLAVVAALPEVAGGARVVHHGKVLPQTPQSKLFDFGIRSDTRVFIASGRYSLPDTITLLEVEEDVNAVAEAINRNQLTDIERKGYYEELMRILFRTDGLMDLEGEWRQRRKDAVAHIKRLQDTLYPDGD